MSKAALSSYEILEWQFHAGVDEAIAETPQSYWVPDEAIFSVDKNELKKKDAPSPATTPAVSATPALHHRPSEAAAEARKLADAASSIGELRDALNRFDGCAIKKTAQNLVFADGNPQARLMIIGDAPDGTDDKQGMPFSGENGKLLDKMLAAIGLDRQSVYLSNAVFWRPPGNRQPSVEEINSCLPFLEKHIALAQPKLLLLMGGAATRAVLNKDLSTSRLRGKLHSHQNDYLEAEVPAIVSFHPSYLIRSPGQKRLAWEDLLNVKEQI